MFCLVVYATGFGRFGAAMQVISFPLLSLNDVKQLAFIPIQFWRVCIFRNMMHMGLVELVFCICYGAAWLFCFGCSAMFWCGLAALTCSCFCDTVLLFLWCSFIHVCSLLLLWFAAMLLLLLLPAAIFFFVMQFCLLVLYLSCRCCLHLRAVVLLHIATVVFALDCNCCFCFRL